MTFDRAQLTQALRDVETYLGYLKGNEMAYEYLEKVKFENAQYDDRPDGSSSYLAYLDRDYRFPCPDSRWEVTPGSEVSTFTVYVYVDPDNPPPGLDTFIKEVQANADQAWHNGAGWAEGLADYCESVCDQFLKPDAQLLADTIVELNRDVVDELRIGVPDDWADLDGLLANWHGDGKHEFSVLYNNLGWALQTYGAFTSWVSTAFALSAKIIHGTQLGALEFVEDIRDLVQDQLYAWVQFGCPPTAPPTTPSWIADVKGIAASAWELVGHLPLARDVKDVIDDVNNNVGAVTASQDLVAGIRDITGGDLPRKDPELAVQDADDIYRALTRTLHQDFYEAYVEALDELHTGAAVGPADLDETSVPFSSRHVTDLQKTVEDLHDWELDKVPDKSLWSPDSEYRF